MNFCTVENICEISRGKVISKDFIKENYGEYPVYSSQTENNGVLGWISTFDYDGEYLTWTTDGANAGTVFYRKGRFNITNVCGLLKPKNSEINIRYLYFALKLVAKKYVVQGMGNPKLMSNVMGKIKIPVPPLDVQKRIVNVLDNFEKICSDLNIGLPAEIEARRKQYEYYRDKLLTFAETGNTILSRAEQSRTEQSRALIKLLQYVFGYAVVSLQDVVKNSCSGGTPKKGVSEYYEDGNIPWLRTQEVVFRDICKTECFITESAVKNSAAKWIPENCVIVAISGATAGRCAINKIPLTTNQHCLNLEVDPEMALYRYVYYCICAKQEELLAKKEGARGDLNSTRILSLQIDLPSIEKQKRIVSILDRFDAICNDLTSGLPTEIEARQKQYEYYRDRLLSFKELN
ncbi:MAG: restriction endonuclease subunit S [Faecalibacterium prausnitzii]